MKELMRGQWSDTRRGSAAEPANSRAVQVLQSRGKSSYVQEEGIPGIGRAAHQPVLLLCDALQNRGQRIVVHACLRPKVDDSVGPARRREFPCLIVAFDD